MPVTEGHYNVIFKGKWGANVDVINSFYFNVALNGGTLVGDDNELFSVGKHIWDAFKSTLLACLSGNTVYQTVDVFKADGSDVGASGFYSIPTGEGDGDIAGEALPPNVVWSFQYTRPNAFFRHGYKRFTGIAEADQSNGLATGGAITRLNALAVALKTPVALNDALLLTPKATFALVQREKNHMPVDPDVWYTPSTVVYKLIGTQNSRKYGRGS